jgi:biopolymer transport protein ExbB
MRILTILTLSLAVAASATGQSTQSLSQDIESDVQKATEALAAQRKAIAGEKIPIAKKLGALQRSVQKLRSEANRADRMRDSSSLDLNALEADIKARQDEVDYLNNLLVEYLTSLESRLHPAELPTHLDTLAEAFRTVDNPSLPQSEKWDVLMNALEKGVEHVDTNIGGAILDGEAVADGSLLEGRIILFGPSAFFVSGDTSGILLEGETEVPILHSVGSNDGISEVAETGEGLLAVDTTLGRAVAILETEESLMEHIQKGGIWIYPILGFAFVATLLSFFKLYENSRMSIGKNIDIRPIVAALKSGDTPSAIQQAKQLPVPANELILTGIDGAEESKEILEEMLLERIVTIQPRLERLLPFVQVTAAVAPLLGLLGTVTGMINTFKLITIFGTGDARQLSGGISEALITTEFGLIVAIPSLIAFAILNRQAKSTLANLEKLAMSFVNGVCATTRETK